jgi:lysyl-tRNA synthetase class 2
VSRSGDAWEPSANLAVLRQRAAMLARARQFFADARVLEVDTPVVVGAAVSDVHIESVMLEAHAPTASRAPRFLHTSPEYAMKRLLAGGSGDIYQICHVMRGFERSALHNPEFTLIEWYRIGVALEALMQEVESLVRVLLDAAASGYRSERLTYREAFLRELHLDPFEASLATLDEAAHAAGYRAAPGANGAGRDELLELLMGTIVGPRLGRGALTFVCGYPASQAALARLDAHDPRAARRFELYCEGLELANGFHELASASEQRARFERDRRERAQLGLPAHALDERLLAALEAGLPDCCGVALGFDRVAMLATHARHIDEVLAFPDERA